MQQLCFAAALTGRLGSVLQQLQQYHGRQQSTQTTLKVFKVLSYWIREATAYLLKDGVSACTAFNLVKQ